MADTQKTSTEETPGQKKTTEETHKDGTPQTDTKKETVERPNPSQR